MICKSDVQWSLPTPSSSSTFKEDGEDISTKEDKGYLDEQFKWIQEVYGLLPFYVGGMTEDDWLTSFMDLQDRLRAGSVECFYILSEKMTICISNDRAFIDCTTVPFRTKLDEWKRWDQHDQWDHWDDHTWNSLSTISVCATICQSQARTPFSMETG